MDHLLEVLSLGRLQGLQQLHWIPCVQYDPDLPILDIIAENHAGIRQISLDMVLYFRCEGDDRTKLATTLVKFCVVDFTHCQLTRTFLRALLLASRGANSKLKTIKISAGYDQLHLDTLGEARQQGVAITVVPPAASRQPLDTIQIDDDEGEENTVHSYEGGEKLGDNGREGYVEEEYKDEEEDSRFEDFGTNKHNEDPLDPISLSLHRSSGHSSWRIVKVEEDGHLREAPLKFTRGAFGHCPFSFCTTPPHSNGHSGALYFRADLSDFVKSPF